VLLDKVFGGVSIETNLRPKLYESMLGLVENNNLHLQATQVAILDGLLKEASLALLEGILTILVVQDQVLVILPFAHAFFLISISLIACADIKRRLYIN
jgi:hypothetical protein